MSATPPEVSDDAAVQLCTGDRSDSAIAMVQETRDSAYLAGGTTEVDLVRQNVLRPALLVDINDLPLNGSRICPAEGFASARWRG